MNDPLLIKYFGNVAEIVGTHEEQLQLSFNTIEQLRNQLTERYPKLINLEFKIAVNQKITEGTISSKTITELALLPPFAGG